MFAYSMENTGSTPKYLYLYQKIRDDIVARRIPSGQRLPSKRALAQKLNVGLVTVANAYELLVAEGYVSAQERKGFFTLELPEEFLPRERGEKDGEPSPSPQEKEDFMDFSANRISMKLFPAATWNQLMRNTLNQGPEIFDIVPYNGLLVLRQAIARHLYSSRGMQVDPSQIIIGAGTEYLYSRLPQLLGRSAVFGFEDPGYKKLAVITKASGNLSRFVPIDGAGVRMDMLEESDVDVMHVSPANQFPTGVVMPIIRRGELLEWAYRASKRYIIEDDYDSEFRYRGSYILPLYTQDTKNRVIYMNTFSKTMVPSLRISYMVLPPKLLQRYQESMSFYSCTVSSFEQYTLAQFITRGYFDRHINRIKTYYRKLRVQVLEALAHSRLSAIAQVVEHNSGTHFLLKINTELTEEEIRRAGAKAGLQISLYSDYAEHMPEEESRLLIINYAAIEPEKVEGTIQRLEQLFPECAAQGSGSADR